MGSGQRPRKEKFRLRIGPSDHWEIECLVIDDLRFSTLEFRFLKSANWFIFSPDTADNRCGEVCHEGTTPPSRAWSQEDRAPPRTSDFGLCISSLIIRHLSLVTVLVIGSSKANFVISR